MPTKSKAKSTEVVTKPDEDKFHTYEQQWGEYDPSYDCQWRTGSFELPDDGQEGGSKMSAEDFAKMNEQISKAAALNPYAMMMPPPGMGPPMPGMMPGMPGMPMPGMMPGLWPQMPMMPGMGYGMIPPGFDPSSASAGAEAAQETGTETTVMWKNLPNNYTRDGLLKLMDDHGFAATYDFFYSPVDFTSGALVGYAFVNFVSHEAADRFFAKFENFKKWDLKSEKTSKVTWSHPLQGLSGHIDRYRNSPVMHPDVADDKKPLRFKDGIRIPFEEPTKKLKPPHPKDCRPKQ